MKKILLLCAAGMSTSLLVTKMKNYAKEKNIDVQIEASSVESFTENLPKYDIFLLGPQVRFKQEEFRLIAKEYNKKVEIINMVDYGTMNGQKVLEDALSYLDK
ncbi:MAG: PTS sugar transporter subunit IIB [Fusobacteriaceae bacterium]